MLSLPSFLLPFEYIDEVPSSISGKCQFGLGRIKVRSQQRGLYGKVNPCICAEQWLSKASEYPLKYCVKYYIK